MTVSETMDGGALANMRKDAHLSDRVTEIAFRTQGTEQLNNHILDRPSGAAVKRFPRACPN